MAQLRQAGGHPPHQGGGGAGLRALEGELVQLHLRHAVVAGLDADGAAAVGHDAGDGVQIHAARQAPAPLVVRVVAAQLRAARRGEEPGLVAVRAGEGLRKLQGQLPQTGRGLFRVRAIDRRKPLQQTAARQLPQQISSSHDVALHPLFYFPCLFLSYFTIPGPA